jgi:predicted phosphohydrolase
MTVWALSDPHLAFGVPGKTMEAFGPVWENYAEKIKQHWEERISPEDLVLIPGDISWAMHLKEALVDLRWIDALPGKKVILRGNHDHWWSSFSKLVQAIPASITPIQNNAMSWVSSSGKRFAIGGSRLWDTPEYSFNSFIEFRENPLARRKTAEEFAKEEENAEKIFDRELERLRLSLSQLDSSADVRIALTHYPPIGPELAPSRASEILEEFRIDICVFGHLHNVREGTLPFGSARGVKYIFASCDYLRYKPIRIF